MAQLGVFNSDYYNSASVLPQSGIATSTQLTATVLAASNLVGAQDQYLVLSGNATAVALTTDSAVNIIGALQNTIAVQNTAAGNPQGVQPVGVPNLILLSYTLTIVNNNTGTGTITLTGGTGVTIVGTNTVAEAAGGTSRTYVVKVTSPTTVSMTNVASGAG